MQHHQESVVISPYGSKIIIIDDKHFTVELILDQVFVQAQFLYINLIIVKGVLIALKKNKGVLDPMAADKAKRKIKQARKSGKKISKEEWIKKLAEKREQVVQQKQSNKINNQGKIADQRR